MIRDQALKRIKQLDVLACDANSLWHSLESIKQSLAKDAGLSKAALKREDVFVADETPTFADAIRLARGCFDYGGGYRANEERLKIFHHGIQTVVNVLKGVAEKGYDTQSAVVYREGGRYNAAGERSIDPAEAGS